MKFLKLTLAVVILSFLGCSTTLNQLNDTIITEQGIDGGKGYVFVSVKKDFADISNIDINYLVYNEKGQRFNLYMKLDKGKMDNKIFCYELPAGNYILYMLKIESTRFGDVFRKENRSFIVKEGAVNYLHRMTYVLTEGGVGLVQARISNQLDQDAPVFTNKFPKFNVKDIINSVQK